MADCHGYPNKNRQEDNGVKSWSLPCTQRKSIQFAWWCAFIFWNWSCTKHEKDNRKGHGRIEKREYFLETQIEWLYGRERWAGLKAIGGVKSTVTIKEEKSVETRYFITSLNNIDDFARAVRAHWGIENGLHWHLDVTFGEDSSRIRNKNATGVWNVLRKLVLEHIKRVQSGGKSLKSLRKLAGWDSAFLERILFAPEKGL